MKLHLWPKHYNYTQNRTKSVSYTSSPLSSYLGALELQFSLGPFYIFVALSLIGLYQLESSHLDDSNLIYNKNKNRGFTEILKAFPLLYNMIFMPSIQILFFSNQFQCIIPQFHKSLTNFNISYKIQHQTLTIHSLDFSNPNLIHVFLNFFQIHHDSTLNTPIGVLSTKPQQIKGLCDLSTKTLGLEQTNLHRKTLAITPITLDTQKTLDFIQKKTYLCSSPSYPSSSSSSSSLLLHFLLHTGALAFVRPKK